MVLVWFRVDFRCRFSLVLLALKNESFALDAIPSVGDCKSIEGVILVKMPLLSLDSFGTIPVEILAEGEAVDELIKLVI